MCILMKGSAIYNTDRIRYMLHIFIILFIRANNSTSTPWVKALKGSLFEDSHTQIKNSYLVICSTGMA